MKKRLLVFANGWGTEYLKEIVTGISEICKDADIDIFTFVDFTFFDNTSKVNISESNIFRLPDIRDFDYTVILTNSFNTQEEINFVYNSVMESGIPAVSLEYDLAGIPSIHTDNYSGMYELTNHLIQKHGVRHIVYVSGPPEHAENAMRLRAVRNAAQENKLTIQDEDILLGNWSRDTAIQQVYNWIHQHPRLPDAFICANDMMAAGVYDVMTELGFQIPNDVLVTGFDYTKTGQELDPPLATVSHDWRNMGRKAMQLLLDMEAGKEVPAFTSTKTQFICDLSCGCNAEEEKAPVHHIFDALRCDSHFRHVHMAIRKADTAEKLHESLKSLLQTEHWMEGDNFMLCLEQEFFHIEDNDENLRTTDYNEYLEVIFSLENGIPGSHQIINRKDALFRISNAKSEPGIYIFAPLYSEDRTYGFVMMARSIDIVEENYLYIWTRHMNLYLEQVRRNITIADLTRKLTILSVTDVLTGLYNRAGCEQIAYPMLEEAHRQGKVGVIMLADVDRMKTINDQYGHASGDLALRTVANILKRQLPPDWIISRFGGDEFFAGGELKREMDLKKLMNSISQELHLEVERQQISFHLSLSIGYIKIDPNKNIDLENDLRQVDQYMYGIKEKHHKEMDSK